MQLPRILTFAALLVPFALSVPRAKADPILFNLDTDGASSSQSLIGFGQGIVVSTTTNLTSIAFNLDSSVGANVEYAIFDPSNTLLYTSAAFSVPISGTHTWYQQAVSYTLQAGSTYYIAYIQNAKVSGSQATGPVSTNGLTSIDNFDKAFSNFAAPRYGNSTGIRNFALQLSGTQASVTPEPGSLLLMGTGLIGCGLLWRRRLLD